MSAISEGEEVSAASSVNRSTNLFSSLRTEPGITYNRWEEEQRNTTYFQRIHTSDRVCVLSETKGRVKRAM